MHWSSRPIKGDCPESRRPRELCAGRNLFWATRASQQAIWRYVVIVPESSNELKSRENPKTTIRLCLVAENRLLRETMVHLFQKRAGITVVGQESFSESYCWIPLSQQPPRIGSEIRTRARSGRKPSSLGWTMNRNAFCRRYEAGPGDIC
jgi:hypothetical protein